MTNADGDDEAVVDGLVEELLRAHPPGETEPAVFLGAQFDLGLAWVDLPRGLGGLEVAPHLQGRVNERLVDAGAPMARDRNAIGHGMVAPTLVVHGTTELRERHLRPLFTGEEVWCQLFSEPVAGSDIAGLATRAVPHGDGWVLTGQKVWTTLGHVARFGLALARTDPDVPKHKGLTAFVVDMHDPAVVVRPLLQMTGHAEFSEVFLDDVVVGDGARVGEVGRGWSVAVTTLMNERVAVGGRVPRRGEGRIAEAVAAWRASGDTDAARRDQLVRLWSEAEILRLTNIRARQLRVRGTPGPEGSIGKITTGELNKRISEFVLHCQPSSGMLKATGYPMSRREGQEPYTHPVDIFLRMRGNSIEGGTTEIAKNIVAERVLGLPTDQRTDKDVAWSSVRRS